LALALQQNKQQAPKGIHYDAKVIKNLHLGLDYQFVTNAGHRVTVAQ